MVFYRCIDKARYGQIMCIPKTFQYYIFDFEKFKWEPLDSRIGDEYMFPDGAYFWETEDMEFDEVIKEILESSKIKNKNVLLDELLKFVD